MQIPGPVHKPPESPVVARLAAASPTCHDSTTVPSTHIPSTGRVPGFGGSLTICFEKAPISRESKKNETIFKPPAPEQRRGRLTSSRPSARRPPGAFSKREDKGLLAVSTKDVHIYMYMYMYTYMYVYICVCMYIHIHIYVYDVDVLMKVHAIYYTLLNQSFYLKP